MTFGVNDLAYTCDIDALNKNVDALAEVSHANDIAMCSIQDSYATVDEVNEVLGNYVLKTDMPSQVDISTLYTKDEADNKFALKSDIPEPVDLTEYYSKNEVNKNCVMADELNEYDIIEVALYMSKARDTIPYIYDASIESIVLEYGFYIVNGVDQLNIGLNGHYYEFEQSLYSRDDELVKIELNYDVNSGRVFWNNKDHSITPDFIKHAYLNS